MAVYHPKHRDPKAGDPAPGGFVAFSDRAVYRRAERKEAVQTVPHAAATSEAGWHIGDTMNAKSCQPPQHSKHVLVYLSVLDDDDKVPFVIVEHVDVLCGYPSDVPVNLGATSLVLPVRLAVAARLSQRRAGAADRQHQRHARIRRRRPLPGSSALEYGPVDRARQGNGIRFPRADLEERRGLVGPGSHGPLLYGLSVVHVRYLDGCQRR